MKNYKNQFDVIIVDSSDPVGPANTLFTKDFYTSLSESLTPGREHEHRELTWQK